MPDIIFTVSNTGVAIPTNAQGNSNVAGCYSRNGLDLLATSDELLNGLIVENSTSNWINRAKLLTMNIIGITAGTLDGTNLMNIGISGSSGGLINLLNKTDTTTTFVMSPLEGSSGATATFPAQFQKEWWSVLNYLDYNSSIIIGLHNGVGFTGPLGSGFTQSTYPTRGATIGNYSTAPYNIIFELSGATNASSGTTFSTNDVVSLVVSRKATGQPIVGIINTGTTGSTITSTSSFICAEGATHTHIVKSFGRKLRLNSTLSTGVGTLLSSQLAPDIAGCMTRANEWDSPAGPIRGKILNVVSLERELNSTERAFEYAANINPITTISGLGTILIGDVLANGDAIYITRTIDYVKRATLPLAYNVLFSHNNQNTRDMFQLETSGMLENLISQGAIDTYTVLCNETNNSLEDITAKKFNAAITVKVRGVINYINITVSNS